MVLLNNDGGDDVASFIIHVSFLYREKKFSAFERQILSKVFELVKDESSESLQKLYCFLDPIYQLLYFDIKSKNSKLSRKMEKLIELAALPFHKMSVETRRNALDKLLELLKLMRI